MTGTDILVLGGGLAGLAVATALGQHAIVLERESRPGGLVRTHERDGWWFDHVLHLLHFRDDCTKARLWPLLADVMQPCAPSAQVVTRAGVAGFPLQNHLGHLDEEVACACLRELEERARVPSDPTLPANYRELLLQSFGPTLCGLFFFPYNSKAWCCDPSELAARGFVWNLSTPDLEVARRGAQRPPVAPPSYNSDAWYPRPAAGASKRGMEVLTQALTRQVPDLRLEHIVERVHVRERTVTVRTPAGKSHLVWRRRCVATLPLPTLVGLCDDVPEAIAQAARALRHTRVVSVAVRVSGPRPTLGMWRYYPAQELVFTRLVFQHEFDPLMAPPHGWPLLAEVPWPGHTPVPDDLATRVECDARRAGVLGPEHHVLGAEVLLADPAYVVFTHGTGERVARIRQWLGAQGIETVGRYGRWEYSSMAQVLRDGFALGDALAADSAFQ